MDVFTTHMVSYSKNPNSDNSQYRYMQSRETLNYVSASDADVKILGGDMNSLPHTGHAQPYGVLRSHLRDALTDRYPDASHDPFFATFGNRRNTYSGRYHEERIDYLLFYAKPGVVDMRVKEFSMPSFMARDTEGKLVSISDHSPLDVEFIIRAAAEYPPLEEEEEDEHYISNIDNHIDEVPRIQTVIPEEAFKTNRTLHHTDWRQPQQQQQHPNRIRWRRPLPPRRRRPPPPRHRTRSGLLRHFSHGGQIKLRPELMPQKKKASGVPMAEVRHYHISRSSLSRSNRF